MFLNKTDRNVLIVNVIHRLKMGFLREGFRFGAERRVNLDEKRGKSHTYPSTELKNPDISALGRSEMSSSPYETLRTFVGTGPIS